MQKCPERQARDAAELFAAEPLPVRHQTFRERGTAGNGASHGRLCRRKAAGRQRRAVGKDVREVLPVLPCPTPLTLTPSCPGARLQPPVGPAGPQNRGWILGFLFCKILQDVSPSTLGKKNYNQKKWSFFRLVKKKQGRGEGARASCSRHHLHKESPPCAPGSTRAPVQLGFPPFAQGAAPRRGSAQPRPSPQAHARPAAPWLLLHRACTRALHGARC